MNKVTRQVEALKPQQVELDEGGVMFSNVIDCTHDAVRIGMRLQVTFEEVAPGIHLPKFRPA